MATLRSSCMHVKHASCVHGRNVTKSLSGRLVQQSRHSTYVSRAGWHASATWRPQTCPPPTMTAIVLSLREINNFCLSWQALLHTAAVAVCDGLQGFVSMTVQAYQTQLKPHSHRNDFMIRTTAASVALHTSYCAPSACRRFWHSPWPTRQSIIG
jgi:hypothetical protein